MQTYCGLEKVIDIEEKEIHCYKCDEIIKKDKNNLSTGEYYRRWK